MVAIAGLYDPAQDPSGAGVTGFEPFAIGVARGVLVGPGEDVYNVEVVIDTPLDSIIQLNLDKPPALNTPGWSGPSYYTVRPFLDFGGEGVIHMNKNGLSAPPEPEVLPNIYEFEPGEESILLTKMAPLTGSFADVSYSFIAGAYAPGGRNPFSVRIEHGYNDISAPIEIDKFLGMPRPIDPAPGNYASDRAVEFAAEGPSDGDGTFNIHLFSSQFGEPLGRMFVNGELFRTGIPDFTPAGFPPFPVGQPVAWTFYRIRVPGVTFDQFTYQHLSALYWSAYAADAYYVFFPQN